MAFKYARNRNVQQQTPSGGFAPSTYQNNTTPMLTDVNGQPVLNPLGVIGNMQNSMAQQNQNNATMENNLLQGYNQLGTSTLGNIAQGGQNIIGGYGQDINNVMGTLGNQEAAGQQQIENQWGATAAAGQQQLQNLGMAGTTVAPTMAAGYQNQESQNLNQFNTAAAAQQANTLSSLNSQDLAAQQALLGQYTAAEAGLGEAALNQYGSMNLGGNNATEDAALLTALGAGGANTSAGLNGAIQAAYPGTTGGGGAMLGQPSAGQGAPTTGGPYNTTTAGPGGTPGILYNNSSTSSATGGMTAAQIAALNASLSQSTASNLTAGNPIGGMTGPGVAGFTPGLTGETAYNPQGTGTGPTVAPTATPLTAQAPTTGGQSLAAPASQQVAANQTAQTRQAPAANPWGGGAASAAPLTNPAVQKNPFAQQYGQASRMAQNPNMAGFRGGKYRVA